MNRDEQLVFCKKCVNQKLDLQEGLICTLTNRKADFVGSCPDFIIDKQKVKEVVEIYKSENESIISFGFSPKQTDKIDVSDFTNKQSYVLAYEAAINLGWNVRFNNENGFIAFTHFTNFSRCEKISIKVDVGNLDIKSESSRKKMVDWGKNRKNIDSFIIMYNSLKDRYSMNDLDEKYDGLLGKFADFNEEDVNSVVKSKLFSSFLVIIKKHLITSIIVFINLMTFISMLIYGENYFLPSIETLLLWGANFRPLTLDGEYWRLLSSVFLHIGLFHFLMNMYALLFIGLLLEPILGKSRFLIAYLLSGIAGSVASVAWNPLIISAGASGAIFGMYGVFLALLSTNLIDKSTRNQLLISIGVFVFYNILIGLGSTGIDNAAHMGGLMSGLLIGYSFYPSLRKNSLKLKLISLSFLCVIFTASSVVVISNTSNDEVKYRKDMELFIKQESQAMKVFELSDSAAKEEAIAEIIKGIELWEGCIAIIQGMDNYNLPDEVKAKNLKIKRYCNLRIISFDLILKIMKEDTDRYNDELLRYNLEIDKLVKEVTSM